MARILVVEDDSQLRQNIQEQLELDSHEVRLASNGRQALDLMPSFLPDLILCDVIMPEMDGIEFIRALRNNATYRLIPLIFLTAKTSRESMIEGLEEGALDYIFKPFLREELILKINNITRHQADLRQLQTQPEHNAKSDFVFVNQFNALLDNQFGEPSLTAQKIADVLNMSRSAFQRNLSTYFGQNFNLILKEYRLQKATGFLIQTDQTIQWIAVRCGFSSLSYFSVCFKKAYHLAPLAFRIKARANLNS
jgi:DNA-binding response OmpR family regulator